MDSLTIRTTFLDFFAARGHRRYESAPLIPQDPSVLLNIAGMLPFAPYFAGDAVPPSPRAVSYQKCVRTNDIENVGRTARHLSFFEMLGNFSFGDYYKREAIRWAWELSVDHLGLEPDRIWASAHEQDDEAVAILLEETGLPRARIERFDRDNFWTTGRAGPSGYCAEFFYDKGPAFGRDGGPAVDDERFVEYYNLVFTEFVCDDDGTIVGRLPASNVDTGMGLERVATILQDVPTAYETDLFAPLIATVSGLTGVGYGDDEATDVSLRIVAEHSRATAFLIADGVLPAKEGRGYVLRRLLRRASRHASVLGFDGDMMGPMLDTVIRVMAPAYPDLERQRELITRVARAEESDFSQRLEQGMGMVTDALAQARDGVLPGDVAFKLHDTYGFPVDLTAEIAADVGIRLDRPAFDELMGQQRRRARAGMRGDGKGVPVAVYREALAMVGPTQFLGYDALATDTELGALAHPGGLLPAASEGDDVEVVLFRTPFYAEGGGQVGDVGTLETDTARLTVLDTQTGVEGLVVHRCRVVAGEVTPGQAVRAAVDPSRRIATARSHSATHILHATLKETLGSHAQQAGSLVQPGRLRLDFPHFEAVTDGQLAEIEATINRRVLHDPHVTTDVMDLEAAKLTGAVANFGDAYGDVVRVVTIGDFSKEFCGGTHVPSGAKIGTIALVREESVGSNTRRIEALTGIEAYEHVSRERLVAEQIARTLGTRTDEAVERMAALMERLKSAEKELAQVRSAGLAQDAARMAADVERVDGDAVVIHRADGATMDQLRELSSQVRGQLAHRAIVVMGTLTDDGKAQLVCVVTDDLADAGVQAREVLAPAAKTVGGGAGGKGGLAQAGGRDGTRLDEALQSAQVQASHALHELR